MFFQPRRSIMSRSLKLVLNTRTRPVWTVAAYVDSSNCSLGVWNRAFVFSRPVKLVSWGLLALSHQIHTLTVNLIFSLCQTVSWPSHLSSRSWMAAYGKRKRHFGSFLRTLCYTASAVYFCHHTKIIAEAGVCNNLHVIYGLAALIQELHRLHIDSHSACHPCRPP